MSLREVSEGGGREEESGTDVIINLLTNHNTMQRPGYQVAKKSEKMKKNEKNSNPYFTLIEWF